jgi:hypothetical protein
MRGSSIFFIKKTINVDLTILVKTQELANQDWYEHVKCKHKFLGSEYKAFKTYNISISIQVLAKDATL